jgi:hypothetical protein
MDEPANFCKEIVQRIHTAEVTKAMLDGGSCLALAFAEQRLAM